MRLLVVPIALATVTLVPAVAEASPYAIQLTAQDLHRLAPEDTAAPAMDGAAPAPEPAAEPAPAAEPTAPAEEPAPADGAAEEPPAPEVDPTMGDPTEVEAPEEGEGEEGLEDALASGKKGDFNANAIGINGGIHLVPSYFLNAALASYANSLCRDQPGNWGEQNGLVKVDGCNFYFNGGYTRRVTRAFDVTVNLGYLHINPPDSLWLDNGEWDRDSCTENDNSPGSQCDIGAADYTRIDLRMFTAEVNFTGRGTLYRNDEVEIQLGGGGGIGVGVLVGDGILLTPLGPEPGSVNGDTCNTLEDTADFTKCTPRYYDENNHPGARVDVDDNGGMAPNGQISTNSSFASCGRDQCDLSDLEAFGTTEDGFTWPAYPIINIYGSFRMIVKDTFGITIDGGIKDGFFFGGGMQYYFGGGGKDK
ncbi:hypothetical protein PPSIR1_32250 [Plesiocystis pacifica SIR-1]|uniref:Uncharacterized protein n=1 Tax=Plesiocystis pacifica SIR-1 TaxID=391625 RepID=A6GIJ0_9BACT|nr:hypothetical protein [Plesiocystis pacifica]EDM74310.1 hypothetical protein PPSIR1_32250 [Plesiocystis pacifica SIR-1]